MISISFYFNNPWSNRWSNVWNRAYSTPFKNKFVELEFIKDNSILSFMFRLTTRQSHGGLEMELGVLGYSFSFNFYDNRHWDSETEKYKVYDQ